MALVYPQLKERYQKELGLSAAILEAIVTSEQDDELIRMGQESIDNLHRIKRLLQHYHSLHREYTTSRILTHIEFHNRQDPPEEARPNCENS